MGAPSKYSSSLHVRNTVPQLVILIGLACLEAIAFFDNLGAFLAVMVLTIVCSVAMAFNRNNILGWGYLVPLYCLTMYAILPTALHGFGIKDDYRGLDGLAEALMLVSGFVGMFSITYTLAERTLNLHNKGTVFSLIEGPPFSVLEFKVSSYVLFPIVAYTHWYSYTEGYFGLHATEGEVGAFAGLASIGQLLLLLWTSYVAVRFWDKNQGRNFIIPLLLSFSLMVGTAFLANSKAAITIPFIIIALSRYLSTGRFPLGFLVSAAAVLLFVAYPIVSGLRMLLIGRTQDIVGDLVNIQEVFLDSSINWDTVLMSLEHLDRSLLITLSDAVSSIGSGMSLLDGSTYGHGLATFIPRFLWPDKPDMDIGNIIGHQFGFLATSDMVTSISPGLIGEAYMNFGVVGCLVGAIVFGLIVVSIDFFVVGYSRYGKLIFALCILWMEGAIGHTFLPFLKSMIGVLLLLFLINGAVRILTIANHRVHRLG